MKRTSNKRKSGQKRAPAVVMVTPEASLNIDGSDNTRDAIKKLTTVLPKRCT